MIEVSSLSKSFQSRKIEKTPLKKIKSWFAPQNQTLMAVNDISFRVEKAESLAFIGPNGAGKSTTIKMLTGILHPTQGIATVAGMIPWRNRKKLAYRIGTVFGQRSQLWQSLPARDSFHLIGLIYEMPKPKFKSRMDHLVKKFELKDFLDRPVRKLSLGERMRCEVAASLLHDPQILFLDEPTIGLDVVAKREVRDLIKQANRDEGVTLFLTSHDAGDIEQVCKRVMVVDQGKIVVDTSTNQLKRDYLKMRLVDLVTEEELPEVPLEFANGIRVLKKTGFKSKLSIDTSKTKMDYVLDWIVTSCSVVDIVVSSPPMEEIIATIYADPSRAPGSRGALPEVRV